MGDTPYIIAEIGLNHKGSGKVAIEHIKAAKDVGCDAVKFQHFDPKCLKEKGALKGLTTSKYVWDDIANYANKVGIHWFASVFSQSALDEITEFQPARWKSAACDLVRASKWESNLHWWASYDYRYEELIPGYKDCVNEPNEVFACCADYPCDLLSVPWHYYPMEFIRGISDHSMSFDVPYIYQNGDWQYFEHHFCIDKFEAVDAAVSFDPAEMRQYVEGIHAAAGDASRTKARLMSYVERWKESK